jgi:transcriptional regulator with XRE-family HTH domain
MQQGKLCGKRIFFNLAKNRIMELPNIGKKIKMLRELRNLTQEHMAGVLGVTQSAYSRMEIGETEITYSKLARIATEIGMKPEDIISFSESMVFNVMNNQTGNGFVIQNNHPTNEERELFKQQIETLKNELDYLKKIIDSLLK